MKRKSGSKNSKITDPLDIEIIKGLELKAHQIVEGFISGLHKSPRHGFSVEFNQHKSYSPGDDIRSMDWRVFGKSDRYYIKQYEEETNAQIHIVLDHSASMKFRHSHPVSKYEYSLYLTVALAYLSLKQRDSVGLYMISDKIDRYLQPSSKQSHFSAILDLLRDVTPDGCSKIPYALQGLANRLHRRSIVIILSDFLDNVDSIVKSLEALRFKNNEVILFQINDQSELDLPFSNMVKYIDSETGKEIIVDMVEIKESYHDKIKKSTEELQEFCNRTHSHFQMITTDVAYEESLRQFVLRRKRMRG